jgi:hypothetical protein
LKQRLSVAVALRPSISTQFLLHSWLRLIGS